VFPEEVGDVAVRRLFDDLTSGWETLCEGKGSSIDEAKIGRFTHENVSSFSPHPLVKSTNSSKSSKFFIVTAYVT
jgi:hypothetical protein